ncbi:hypothetical protein [Pseudoxanthomonas sp. 3HH-4]|uniref:lipase family protein n=1 Tax=Pseudoxanthomonas sp. 3HH-4 TaxID=1690214 RepID=UPI001151B80A|nr:hypothetical protein [Pseudoxanthomonas sp. 3HH-4]
MHKLVDKEVVLEGQSYKVLHFADNPRTGYQGTIYQHVESGEVVVAHRGTEFERQRWRDLIKTDGAMVLTRANLQADDAIALTGLARDYASSPTNVAQYGHPSQVTVTGHSLGGTLAQISAHYYDLRGETFNAYGAVSLDRRIPEGGDRILNHVMAADTVSSASPHYGQVRIYAQSGEIGMLRDAGYANNDAKLLDPRASLLAGVKGFGSHDMHRFLNVDGEKRPDRSVLGDPQAQSLAREYAPMIGKYRADVEGMRGAVTSGARGPYGAMTDGLDALRGPIPPGELGAREDRRRSSGALPEWGSFAATAHGNDRSREGKDSDVEPSGSFHPPLSFDPRSAAVEVDRLLSSAKAGDTDGLRGALHDLKASPFGQDWQKQLEAHRQRLAEPAPRIESQTPVELAR